MRLHRALSRLQKSQETQDDLDMQFISLWISFNAIYAKEMSERIKEGRFFCDLNEERWKIIENQLDNVDMLRLWQTKDNRVDRQEIWLNVILCRTI